MFFSIHPYKPYYNHIRCMKKVYGNPISSLLFFEQGYLSKYEQCILDICSMSLKHANLVDCVSEFSFRTYFITKNGKLLCPFLCVIILDFIK